MTKTVTPNRNKPVSLFLDPCVSLFRRVATVLLLSASAQLPISCLEKVEYPKIKILQHLGVHALNIMPQKRKQNVNDVEQEQPSSPAI